MNRLGAFAIHLGISLIIFVVLGYLILFHWYPDFFFASDGGWQGIRIVALVDLVLGPTLTLVVFNRSKPVQELRRDLSIIGLIQVVCLTAGVWVVYSQRPIAMVFADGYFHSMSSDDYRDIGLTVPDFSRFGDRSPTWVSVRLPEDPAEQSRVRHEALTSETPVRLLTSFYQPFDIRHIDFDRDGYRPDTISDPELLAYLESFADSHHSELNDWIFVPFGTRYRTAVIAVRRTTGEMLFLDPPRTETQQNGGRG